MNLSFYKFLFMKRSVLGLIRNLHRYSDMIIIYKERYNVSYTKYKTNGLQSDSQNVFLQMWGDSQIVSL